jgi:hypothetical protein
MSAYENVQALAERDRKVEKAIATSAWKPMSTAPKTGALVLLLCSLPVVGRWHSMDGWQTVELGGGVPTPLYPAAWLPIPEPPEHMRSHHG